MVEKMPIEAGIVVPLGPLAKLPAHKQQLLARMAEHETVEQTQIGELLPFVARHLAKHRTLAVNHFVVRKGQDEVFRKGVQQAESDLVMLIAAVDRVLRHVIQYVVHPAHVPLEPETTPAEID